MFIPKKYGHGKADTCPFCRKQATSMNPQDVPVCYGHREEILDDLKCVCGSILEMLHGKFGVFFKCISCGNMSLKKVLEFNTINAGINADKINPGATADSKGKTTITVRSDDPRYFD